MKNFFLSSMMLTLYVGLSAQTVTLTFTGRGSDNSYVRLNRVVIDNLSRNWQEVIYWPDTTLSMTNITDVHDYEQEEGFHLSQNTPNPFSGVTDVFLNLDEDGETELTVYDINGKQVVRYSGFLAKGGHNFRINLATAQTYLLKARSGSRTESIKMINNGSAGTNDISYIGEGSPIVVTLKSTTNKPFAYGDIMQYVGYGTVNGTELESSHIVQVQNTSQVFTLQFTIPDPPSVITNTVTNIVDIRATCGGYVYSDGGASVTARGVCWSISQNPTVNDSHTTNGSDTGSFTSNLTNLTPNTTYYVRAYATNNFGTAYGNQVSFTTSASSCPIAIDHDGNSYATVQIGTQCWMAENLRTTHYADGTSIPLGNSESSTTVAYRYYPDNNSSNLSTYGYLYNWSAVMHGSSPSNANPSEVQGICPSGWHVPSREEWVQLETYLKNQSEYLCNSTSFYPDADEYIAKSLASTTGWTSSYVECAVGNDPSANNATGFNARPAGYCQTFYPINTGNSYFGFTDFGSKARFWNTSGVTNDPNKLYYAISYDLPSILSGNNNSENGLSVRCVRNEWGGGTPLPTLTTNIVNIISTTTAICGGNVTADGGSTVTARGVCWSTSQNPTINDNYTTNGNGTGSFTSNMIGLTPNITYYVRAYATNSAGTSYGNQVSFATSCPTVTDYDGNNYNTVQIGSQCWMAENLRTTHYADGTSILLGSSLSTSVAYRYYPGSSSHLSSYGYLYNWPAVMHGSSSSTSNPSGVQGICPTGWHLPSEAEWTQLTNYVSSQSQYVCGNNNTSIAKALASTWWAPSNEECAVGNDPTTNNNSGFNARPAGFYPGGYSYINESTIFWSATDYEWYNAAQCYELNYDEAFASFGGCIDNEDWGCSVRCLRDESGSATQIPSVTTSAVDNIAATHVTSGGNVTSNGGGTVTARGVCWSTSPTPTINNNHTVDGGGMGSFTSNLTGLTAGTTYYARAYATNSQGTAYGATVSFTTATEAVTSSQWIDYASSLNYWFGSESNYVIGRVAVDSNGLSYYSDGSTSHGYFFGLSQTYDFTHDIWNTFNNYYGININSANSYNIDSVEIVGHYNRGVSVPSGDVDTLIVAILTTLTEDDIVVLAVNNGQTPVVRYYGVPYDVNTHLSFGATIYKLPLNSADCANEDGNGGLYPSHYKVPIHLNNINSKIINIAYTFKRGYSIPMNDNIQNHSYFYGWIASDPRYDYYPYNSSSGWFTPVDNIYYNPNQGAIITKYNLNQTNPNSWNNQYFYPAPLWNEAVQYPWIITKISCNDCEY